MKHPERAQRVHVFALLVSFLLLPAASQASAERTATPQGTGASATISGTVVTPAGAPAAGTQLTLLELKRRTIAKDDGTFRFDGVPPGTYLIEALSPRFGQALVRVPASATENPISITLDIGVHRERITVTATGEARSVEELAQPVDVLREPELQERLQSTLGETLATQPGVSSTFFGQGASRPVIRGLGGDRIRILDAGLGAGDVSDTSPDHAVTINTLIADRIEIVRGPATLLYGSSAIGGVVNTFDRRIATIMPENAIGGIADFGLGSVAEEKRGAVSLDGRVGPFVLHGDASRFYGGDYKIPGFAKKEPEPGDEEGRVPNSAVSTDGAAAAVSYVGTGGYLGFAYSGWNSVYGSPAEEAVQLDMKQRRVDVHGEITTPFAFLRGAKLRFGHNDYRHFEIEGGEIGTRFNDNGWEGRLELPHKAFGPVTGAFGVQIRKRDLEAIGEERFIPPTTTDSHAVFLFEEIALGETSRFQVGGRWEHQNVDSPETVEVQSRAFDGYSGSLGLVWQPSKEWSVGLSVARTTKLPTAQELFADGPHIGTNAFEIGDPFLAKEVATGVDFSIRRTQGPVSGSVSLFYNNFDGFIYERFTDEVEDDLQVIRYTQADTRFWGAEGHIDLELVHSDPHHLALELQADYVRAELTETDEPLPRIPPLRFSAALRYSGSPLSGMVEVRRVQSQTRIAPFETETDGYTMLNATVGYRLIFGNVVADLLLRGNNLTDVEARNHLSFLKDVAPLPGRGVSLGLRTVF